MNRLKLWIITALATALALSIIGGVSAQPSAPSAFRGAVISDDGVPVAAGLDVRAYVDGTDCTNRPTTTYRPGGETGYLVVVHNGSTRPGCGSDGDTVRFRIGDRWATQTGVHGGQPLKRVNLTLTDAPPSVTIEVAVWRRIEDPFNALAALYISTKPPEGRWTTHPGQLDMSRVSGTGTYNRSDIREVEVQLSDGSTIKIEVAVWRHIEDPTRLYISTKPPGGRWTTHPGRLDMSRVSGTGNYNRSDIREVEVNLQ